MDEPICKKKFQTQSSFLKCHFQPPYQHQILINDIHCISRLIYDMTASMTHSSIQSFFITAMATESAVEMLGTSCISCNTTTYVSSIKNDGFKN